VPWFLLSFIGVYGLVMDGWYFLVFLIIFAFSVWVVHLSELAKYSRVERYLAAKIGTIYLVLVWWVFFITRDESGFISLLVSSNECYFHQVEMISFIKFCLSLVPGVAGEDTELLRCYYVYVCLSQCEILILLTGFFL
jgi:hypothetical protein